MESSASKKKKKGAPKRDAERPLEAVDPIEPFPDRIGEFHLIRRLASGPKGELFLARQESQSRDVALRLVSNDHLQSEEARMRFHREIDALARSGHPGIVPILGAGEEDGKRWVAAEAVEGCTLAEALEELKTAGLERNGNELLESVRRVTARKLGRIFAPGERDARTGSWVHQCIRITRDLARALDHAHRHEVVHGDVKPGNVVIDVRGRAQLIDFGLAGATSRKSARRDTDSRSLPYMAPERVRGRESRIDARSDVYSLGVTLYEMLALELPFQDIESRSTRGLVLAGEPLPLHELAPGIPWDVETLCLVAMERDQGRRYASAEAFARDLDNFLAQRPIDGRRPGTTRRLSRWIEHNTLLAVSLGLLLPALVLGPSIGMLVLKSERDQLAGAHDALTKQIEQLRTELANERNRDRGARDDR